MVATIRVGFQAEQRETHRFRTARRQVIVVVEEPDRRDLLQGQPAPVLHQMQAAHLQPLTRLHRQRVVRLAEGGVVRLFILAGEVLAHLYRDRQRGSLRIADHRRLQRSYQHMRLMQHPQSAGKSIVGDADRRFVVVIRVAVRRLESHRSCLRSLLDHIHAPDGVESP